MPEFACTRCGGAFSLSRTVLQRYPGWTPKLCQACRGGRRSANPDRGVEDNLTVAEVLDRYRTGPTDGVFTDGSANPNPGPGGWGAVHVVDDRVVAQAGG
ncbi:MAG TPA: hypothetical protein VG452_13590, partial [Egibacteraceae bacterium]|nr:hypothetical protein [Egibacteraceae bacterium]